MEEEYEDLDNTYMEITPISKRMKKITMKVPKKIPLHSLASNVINLKIEIKRWKYQFKNIILFIYINKLNLV